LRGEELLEGLVEVALFGKENDYGKGEGND